MPQLSSPVSSFNVYDVHDEVVVVDAVVVDGASVIVVDISAVVLDGIDSVVVVDARAVELEPGLHAPAWTPEAASAATAKDLAEGIEEAKRMEMKK
jgi:hypothetical protein